MMMLPPRRQAGVSRYAAFALLVSCLLGVTSGGLARAQDTVTPQGLTTEGIKALREGRAGDAVAAFESLADRGVVDPTLSYDRGLAYAARVHIGAEQPGDLGRAAHGFEEARDLSRDPRLIDDAGRALIMVRSEVARRRVLAGESVEVDPGRSLGRALAGLLAEDTWSALCVAAAFAFTVGLFARWLGRSPRSRIAGGVVAGVASPLLLLAAGMTYSTRGDRLTLREAVVVSASARPTDERGIVVSGGHSLPEGARVEWVDTRGPQTRVRFGATDVWVQAIALRELARPD
jgi:hypothetical protein